jgi:hypothetical protein
VDLDWTVPVIRSDAERLRIALVNLIVNARDARESDDARVSVSTRFDGRSVAIVIADRGAGIDRADLPRIFDPYFTTKRGGTGLGLPISKNIVKAWEARSRSAAHPEKAPRFASNSRWISLTTLRHRSPRVVRSLPSKWLIRGSILLVDDEEKSSRRCRAPCEAPDMR